MSRSHVIGRSGAAVQDVKGAAQPLAEGTARWHAPLTNPSMKVLRFATLFVCILNASTSLAGFSRAQDFRPASAAELAMTEAPNTPDAPAAILDWVRVEDHHAAISSEYYRIKIFDDRGTRYADVEVPFFPRYPAFEQVLEISARTIRPDGEIVPFGGETYEKVLYKSGGRQVNAKVFSLRGVKPGSIIEYRYQRRWKQHVLFDSEWILQREIPILHAKLTLKPLDTKGQFVSYFTYVGLPEGKTPKRMLDTYHLELENLPPFHDEVFAPPQKQLRTRVDFRYVDRRQRPDQFWNVQVAEWSKEIEGFIGNPSSYAARTKRGVELHTIYAKVQSLRNLTYSSSGDEPASRNGAEVVTRGAGYASEINRAFVGLARAAGYDAYVIRVAPRNESFFSAQNLDATQLSEEVAAVTVDERTVFLDPGTPGAPFGVLSWEKTNVPGLRIVKGGTLEWVKVPGARPDDALVHRKGDLRVSGDGIEGTVTVSFSGQEALRRRVEAWLKGDAAGAKALEDEARGWFLEGATVKVEDLTGLRTHDGPIVGRLSVRVPVATAGSRLTMPLSLMTATQKNPFTAVTRTLPIYFRYPTRMEDEVAYTFAPTLTPATLPPPFVFDVGSMKYRAVAKRAGNVVTYTRSATIDAMLVEPKHYGALRTYFSAVAAADQHPLLFEVAK